MQNAFVANISIRDVPEAVAETLRRRAARSRRSLQGELMLILERAAAETDRQEVAQEDTQEASQAQRALTTRSSPRTLEDVIRSLRSQLGVTVATPSTSTAIIREMRDARHRERDA